MKRRVLLLLLTALLAFAAPVRADVFLLGFTGFDYEDPDNDAVEPDLDGTTFLNVGEGYKVVGFVSSFGPLLTPYVDDSEFEYTVHSYDLTVSAHTWDAGFQFLDVQFQNGGRGRYFQDGRPGCSFCTPGTPAVFGVNPPNATSPSTFVDGTLLLGGSINSLALFYDFAASQGGFSGQMSLDEGSALGYVPPAQRSGWTLAALAGRPNGTVPAGYDDQLSGSCYIPDPTPARQRTWGAIKALYR
ncbi:MAG: hypothetical protein HOP12_13935 [Candidatus Eisenbacteria bacterium]|uniref:PEP-CTERM sorting domain-containing protein n=1 Tax=Eiseniibacteriota bacterium TaxID=2212470 RepID=A0A849SIP3_UNCEI|nr:hypothetical protein [Candidatus Eisenbacteria bacterium]